MSSPAPHRFTQEHLILHAVWRKAYAEGKISIPTKNISDARRLRFSLYNSVRAVREGKVVAPDLLQAVEECSIRLDGLNIVIQAKTATDLMQAITAALGGEVGVAGAIAAAPVPADAHEIEESQRKLRELLDTPDAGTRTTPYYTR